MKKAIRQITEIIDASQEQIRDRLVQPPGSAISFYRKSIRKMEDSVLVMARDHKERFLMVFSERQNGFITRFTGEQIGDAGIQVRLCPLDHSNAKVIREAFPWAKPVSLRRHKTTVGCGDRLGIAAPGHVAAISLFPSVKPVLAQQSMRELALTGRTYKQVVDDATYGVFQVGYQGGFGADGDHLKTIPDIEIALAAGMPMITLDLSEQLNAAAALWDDAQIETAFAALPEAERVRLLDSYAGKPFKVGDGSLELSAPAVKRCAVIYSKAIDFAAQAHAHLGHRRGEDFDLEISIDETTTPTLPEHHLFLTLELHHREVGFSSLAPRFVGEFQKGIDYRGDLDAFTAGFKLHRDIAATHGNYKLSIHSGSDKFSVFPVIGALTKGLFHLKTAGTSWLEALFTCATKDKVLFKVIYKRSTRSFNDAKALYHVGTTLEQVPDIDDIDEEDYPALLNNDHARQLLHVTYGAVLNTPSIRPLFFESLHRNEEFYHAQLKGYFERHLDALKLPRA